MHEDDTNANKGHGGVNPSPPANADPLLVQPGETAEAEAELDEHDSDFDDDESLEFDADEQSSELAKILELSAALEIMKAELSGKTGEEAAGSESGESAIAEEVATAELDKPAIAGEVATAELDQPAIAEEVATTEADPSVIQQIEANLAAELEAVSETTEAELPLSASEYAQLEFAVSEHAETSLEDMAPHALDADNKQPQDEGAVALDPIAKYAAILNGPPQETGGIEILIQMAAKGEIDPKNIDIIDVTDRFLRAISAVPKENLRQSGKIIFQASVLLRMKAEALLAARVEEELGFGDDYVDFDIDGSPIIYDSNHQIIGRQITLADLERALVRQTKLRQLRHRRVTLEQLIEALREAERLEAQRGERKIKARIAIDGYAEMRDMDDILDLAHDEDIEDVIARIERLLVSLLESEKLLPLLAIIEALGGRGDWVDAFLAVLFLSNAGKITLEQQEFYGPLFIAPASAEAGLAPPTVQNSPPMTH